MLLFNNKTPKKINFNGKHVAKVIFNNVVVWLAKVLTTITGYPITLSNSTGDDLVDYKIYGNSVQDGTPSPETPIEIQSVGDKTINILDINEWSQTNSSTQYIKVENDKMYVRGGPLTLDSNSKMVKWIKNNIKANTYYTFNFKRGENSYINGQIRLYYTIDGTKYRTDICDSNVTLKAFKLSKNVLDNLTSIYFYGANNDTSYIYDVMIVEGSNNAESIPNYEPYGYKIPVNINRNNSYDKNTIKNGFVPISGTYPTQNSTYPNAQYQTIKLDGGKTYYFTTSVKTDGRIRYADPLTPNISINLIQSSTLNNEYFTTDKVQDNQFNDATFTIKKDVILIILGLKGLSSYTDLSFKEEPLITNIYLDEPLRKIGDYADYIDFANKKVVRNISKYVFQGNESGAISRTYNNNQSYYIHMPNLKSMNIKSGEKLLCNILSYMPNTQGHLGEAIGYGGNTSLLFIALLLEKATTYQEAINILKDNIVYGISLTPTEETIELPTIPTYTGTTIIEVDTAIAPSNMEVEYYAKGVL